MIHNNGDNQNKKAWELRMFCTMKALQGEAFFIVTIVVNHMQNLDVCVWLYGTFSQNIV